jgi:hypothetical protein
VFGDVLHRCVAQMCCTDVLQHDFSCDCSHFQAEAWPCRAPLFNLTSGVSTRGPERFEGWSSYHVLRVQALEKGSRSFRSDSNTVKFLQFSSYAFIPHQLPMDSWSSLTYCINNY